MKVRAIQSFIGTISMNIDDEKEIINKKLAEELIKSGYVVEVKATKNNNLVAEPMKKESKRRNNKK